MFERENGRELTEEERRSTYCKSLRMTPERRKLLEDLDCVYFSKVSFSPLRSQPPTPNDMKKRKTTKKDEDDDDGGKPKAIVAQDDDDDAGASAEEGSSNNAKKRKGGSGVTASTKNKNKKKKGGKSTKGSSSSGRNNNTASSIAPSKNNNEQQQQQPAFVKKKLATYGSCWYKHLEELRAFKDKHGHARIPNIGNGLPHWIRAQRIAYSEFRDGKKRPEGNDGDDYDDYVAATRVRLLNDVGFPWEPSLLPPVESSAGSGKKYKPIS